MLTYSIESRTMAVWGWGMGWTRGNRGHKWVIKMRTRKLWGRRGSSLSWLWWWFHGYRNVSSYIVHFKHVQFILCQFNFSKINTHTHTTFQRFWYMYIQLVYKLVHLVNSPSVYSRTQHKLIVLFLNMCPQIGDWLKLGIIVSDLSYKPKSQNLLSITAFPHP